MDFQKGKNPLQCGLNDSVSSLGWPDRFQTLRLTIGLPDQASQKWKWI